MTTVAGIRPAAPLPRTAAMGIADLLLTLNRNPLEAFTQRHFVEPIVAGASVLGRFAVVSDPAAIRTILLDEADRYPKDELQKRLLKPALGNGLLTSEGKDWQAQRHAFAPAFTPRSIETYLSAMAAEAGRLVRRLEAMRPGRPIDVAEQMTRAMLDMLAGTLFTDGLGRPPAEFRASATHYFETQGRVDPLDIVGAPSWIPRIGRVLSRPALAFFPKVVEGVVAARRRARDTGQTEARDDLVTALLDSRAADGAPFSDADIAANIITFIGAGFETPANALTWALYLLSLDADWRARVEAEVDAVTRSGVMEGVDLRRLVLLRAHLDEAMRLYPPVAIITRRALDNHWLVSRWIVRGTTMVVAPWIIHRHRALWDAPDEFRPERFLPHARKAIPRFAYLPFGIGPRVCIGASFAMQQMLVTLASVTARFRFDVADGQIVRPVHRVTLRPEGGLMMTVRPR